MTRTSIAFDAFSNQFIVTRELRNADGTPTDHSIKRVTERELRSIGDQDINETIDRAKNDYGHAFTLPAPRQPRIARRGHIAGYAL